MLWGVPPPQKKTLPNQLYLLYPLAENQDLGSKLSEMRRRLEHVEEARDLAQATVARHERRIAELASESAAHANEILRLQNIKIEVDTQLRAAKDDVENLGYETTILQATADRLRNEATLANQQLTVAQQESNIALTKVAATQQQVDRLQSENVYSIYYIIAILKSPCIL